MQWAQLRFGNRDYLSYNPTLCSIAPLLLIFLFHRFWRIVAASTARLLRNSP